MTGSETLENVIREIWYILFDAHARSARKLLQNKRTKDIRHGTRRKHKSNPYRPSHRKSPATAPEGLSLISVEDKRGIETSDHLEEMKKMRWSEKRETKPPSFVGAY